MEKSIELSVRIVLINSIIMKTENKNTNNGGNSDIINIGDTLILTPRGKRTDKIAIKAYFKPINKLDKNKTYDYLYFLIMTGFVNSKLKNKS